MVLEFQLYGKDFKYLETVYMTRQEFKHYLKSRPDVMKWMGKLASSNYQYGDV